MDDIYSFEELIPLPCKIILEGVVQSDNKSTVLSNIEVILLDENQIQLDQITSDKQGKYQFLINCNHKYAILIQNKGFIPVKTSFETTHLQNTFIQNIVLQKDIPVFKIGDDIGKKISILPIYFDLGKSNIRQEAAQELTKIKSVLEEYPTMILEIRSHTDSRDTAENNQILSTKRAESTVNWFIENGISPNRISGKGFGESQLLNHCSDGINCSESEHQLNRRSEFIVTRI
jgi:outer membrane protein OmpA-like peptidoglycan-associated protein